MYKKLLAVIFSLGILAGCTANEGTEATEASGTVSTVTSAESTVTTAEPSETTTVTTESEKKITTEAIDTSSVDYIKETLQTEWNEDVAAVNIYAADLNGDGVKELFINYSLGAGINGFVYVYDVSDGIKKLYEISARIWADKAQLYADTDGKVHFILKNGYASFNSSLDYAFFDITHDSIKMPFYADDYQYHNDLGHVFEYNIYKNCEVVPNFEHSYNWRNFDPEKAEYIGRFDDECFLDAINNGKSNEISEIIQKEVFDGLTYISDVEEIYSGAMHVNDFEDFDGFWEKAAPKLAEVYSSDKTAEKLPIDAELCINEDGTLNENFTERLTSFATPDGPVAIGIFPALWDFDEDGVPEIILIYHSGGQGRMTSNVYSAETLEEIGEFEGFCRDGITRFYNNDEGTVIHNFYEHSNWQRVETVEIVSMEQEKLVSQSEIIRHWSNNEEYNPRLKYWEGGSNTEELSYKNMTAEKYHYIGNVCSSYYFCSGYDDNIYGDIRSSAEIAVESYNNYIKAQALKKSDSDKLFVFGGRNQYAVFQTEEGCFFIDENGERTLMKKGMPYFDIYMLWDDIIVGQHLGNTMPCDVYVMTDGKPVLDEKLSGHGMYFDYSHFYNGRYEIIESVYDATSVGAHTFKKYQFYRDKDGFHEYGSIKVPLEEFNPLYGEAAQVCIDKLAKDVEAEHMEVHEVLYRGDCSFILNCREPIILSTETDEPFGYKFYNITLKLDGEGRFSEIYRDMGVYKTALIPEIAVYPEEMYIPETAE
ncbi:MAG: hypothetical protein K2G04_03060 [Oscillospiraceae bacterium]|nr:hypothetical protein [Oscillospiraceae bacterium]